MENPAGKSVDGPLRLDFDRRLTLQCRGSVVTSDAGLLAYREFDDAFGPNVMAGGTLADARTGRNGRHAVTSRARWRRPSIAKFAQDGHSLLYCDSLGGAFADQSGNSIAVFHGFAYVTGTINGRFFPVVNSFQDSPPGGRDVFVSKISQDGNSFSYSTYLGGNQNDEGNAIAVGSGGDAYVTGRTGRTDIGAEHDRKCRGQIDKPSGSKARDHETRCGTTLQDSGDAHSCESRASVQTDCRTFPVMPEGDSR